MRWTATACLRLPLCFAALLAAVCCGVGVSASPARSPLQKNIDALVQAGVPGVIALVEDGGRTVRLVSGFARVSPREAMNPVDRFRVGSITKSFVATVLLQLVGERKLTLDDSLEHWLPGLVPNGRAITIRELLQHTSGVYDYTNDAAFRTAVLANPLRVWTPSQLVKVAVSHRPLFAPGRRWSYSNTNYVLAGLVLEAVTHRTVADELRDRIFRPLRLHGTSFPVGPTISGPRAHGYLFYGTPLVRDTSYVSASAAWAAGAIVSTVDDVSTFYRSLLGGRLLRPALLAKMESTIDTGNGNGYGLGLLELRTDCGRMFGHDGDFPGYASEAFTSPDGKRQLVLFMNSDQFGKRINKALAEALNTGLCGHPFA
jgi:D-alanyl-D-alanine carboxypeptidase